MEYKVHGQIEVKHKSQLLTKEYIYIYDLVHLIHTIGPKEQFVPIEAP
jgi:hypothetical protein